MEAVIVDSNRAMVGASAVIESVSSAVIGKEVAADSQFDLTAVAEPVPAVVKSEDVDGAVNDGEEQKREIVLGRNIHTTCLAVTEPDADDESTGDKEAYMASVLARYRKTLTDRTKYHLGIVFNLILNCDS